MKCVCRKPCQVRMPGGYIQTFNRGEVFDFEKCPLHFESIEPVGEAKVAKVDFATAGEAELLASDFDIAEMQAYIRSTFNKVTESTDRESLVRILLDCRFRQV